jgi:hypothetical protein
MGGESAKVAVVGVLYSAVSSYLKGYLKSLENQTFKQFDLILANDGMVDAEDYLGQYSLRHQLFQFTGTPGKVRYELIKIAVNAGYEKIIFTDCDDMLCMNRVEVSSELLERSPIVVNDLNIINEENSVQKNHYFLNRIEEGYIITVDNLLHSNMMGLTNTSATRDVLEKTIKNMKTVNVVAFDWLLWTQALLHGYNAEFTASTTTNYRVYSGNVAGLPQSINRESVLRGVAIKEKHYGELFSVNEQYSKLYQIFSKANKSAMRKNWLKKYIEALQVDELKYPMWWENIKEPELVGIE